MAGTPSRLEDCDHEDMAIITYCGLYAPHRYESCREEQETLKVHRNMLGKKLKRVMKALSEILVWPKKSFSLRRLRTCTSGANKDKKKRMQFQYDPKSYALNFDYGIEEGDGVFLDFSARYACPLGINKVYLGWEHSET